MTEDTAFSFYLSRSDCPPSEITSLNEKQNCQLPPFLTESLTGKEASETLKESFKRRIILNPFTDEDLRTKLLSEPENLEESFILSMAAEAFKTISVKRALKQLQDHTKATIDWPSIESQTYDEMIDSFAKGNQDVINKLTSI